MKTSPLIIAAVTGLLSATVGSVSAQTVYRMTFDGSFTQNSSNGHPDIKIGDTFSFALEFDTSAVTGAGTDTLHVNSILSSSLNVNGVPHAFGAPNSIIFSGDFEGDPGMAPDEPANLFLRRSPSGTNNILLNPTLVSGGFPSAVGDTVEVDDILKYSSLNFGTSDFVVSGSDPVQDAVRGPLTGYSLTVVPESGGAFLVGLAGMRMMVRRRR